MSKKSKKHKKKHAPDAPDAPEAVGGMQEAPAGPSGGDGPRPKMTTKEYEKEMRVLQGELVAMQEWVRTTGARVCVVFEGLDSAGKGGTIRRITERTSPRVFKHIALPAPDARVKSQMYVQRYMAHFPSAGEVAIFDRSWYNRAVVEPIFGFCTPKQYDDFMHGVVGFEKDLVRQETLLVKLYFSVTKDEQARRFEAGALEQRQRGVDHLDADAVAGEHADVVVGKRRHCQGS